MTSPHPPATTQAPLLAICALCDGPITGPRLTDRQTAHAFHPDCVMARLPQDAFVALIAVAALVLVPVIVVWAG